ncbi:MAG: endolytic transglycosylase MltG [Nitrospiraceae bacterium]|nr:endolytic transglycosylase MltG [Nitrospiraceae bacterium]
MIRRRFPWIVLIVIVVIGITVSAVATWMLAPLVSAPRSALPPVQIVDIPDGATFRQVADLLKNERLIASRWGFLLLGKLTWADRRIIPGEYALHAGMQPREILNRLRSGQVVLHPVTIPEGFTIAQIAEVLELKGLAVSKEFVGLTHDHDFILTAFKLDVPSLEGYLFPDTYHVPRRTKAKDIITVLVDGMWRTLTPEWRARARDIGMSVHEVLTLASVIEKETGVDQERELVSSVFHNRLQRRIPLQSDPTVIYGMTLFDGNLKKRDLNKASPYNTYRVVGLPPGPIANPGAQSIKAALYPAPTSYLYFVSRNNGTHEFSSTLAEHNRAVEKYQRQPVRRLS